MQDFLWSRCLVMNQLNLFQIVFTFLFVSRLMRAKVKTNLNHTRKKVINTCTCNLWVLTNSVFLQLNGRVLMWKRATIKTSNFYVRNCNQFNFSEIWCDDDFSSLSRGWKLLLVASDNDTRNWDFKHFIACKTIIFDIT